MTVKQSDVDFLRNYAAGGGTVLVQNAQGQYVQARSAPDTVVLNGAPATQQLPENQPGGPAGSDFPTQPGRTPTPQQQREQAKQQAAKDKAQRRAVASGAMLGAEAVGGRFAALSDRVNAWSERAAAVPKPGGIAAMVVLLGIAVSAIVPVNQGYTRLQLAWMTLLNQTFIPEAAGVEQARENGTLGNQQNGNGGSNSGIVTDIQQAIQNGVRNVGGGGSASVASGVRVPINGQLPIAPPLPSTGIRGF